MSTVRILEAAPDQFEWIRRIEQAAFGREDEAQLVAALLQDPTAQPLLSLLAVGDDEAVGHALFTHVDLAAGSLRLRAAILAPLAVMPSAQRQGVGRALIEQGAGRLAAAGAQLLFVLGDPRYYTRCGFRPASPYRLNAPYPIVPEEAWMVRPLTADALGSAHGTITCAESLMKPEYWRE